MTDEQREAKRAALTVARAALAAKRAQNKEDIMAAPEGLATTIATAPETDPAILARAAEQLAARTAKEEEAFRQEQIKQGFNPAEPTPLQKGNAQQANNADLMARAARQRAMEGKTEQPMVKARVTKLGDGKVSMGIHVAGIGEAYHIWKEDVLLEKDVAIALEVRGFVEIED